MKTVLFKLLYKIILLLLFFHLIGAWCTLVCMGVSLKYYNNTMFIVLVWNIFNTLYYIHIILYHIRNLLILKN